MINWNAIPATYNEAWTYLEMLGKLVSVVNRHEDDIKDLQTEVTNIWENFANYYTKAEADAHFISEDDLLNYYTKEEANELFARSIDLIPMQQQINELKTAAALGGSVELVRVDGDMISVDNFGVDQKQVTILLGKYEVLTEQPNDWATNYTDYYYFDRIEGEYKKIEEQALPPQFIAGAYYAYAPKVYDSIQLSITYKLVSAQNAQNTYTYRKTYTTLINRNLNAYDFVMYDTSAGGAITVSSQNDGDVYVYITLLDNSDTISEINVTAVLYTNAKEATQAEKEALYALADVDGNGEITISDTQTILDFAVASIWTNLYPNTDEGYAQFMHDNYPNIYASHIGDWKMPDIDGNGVVNDVDARITQVYYAITHISENFPDTVDNFYYFVTGQIEKMQK